MSAKIALRPHASHPGGIASIELADAESVRLAKRRAHIESALARSVIVRRAMRDPLLALPTLGALGHFLVWLF